VKGEFYFSRRLIMKINSIKNVSGLITFISENSPWSPVTVSNVICALGCRKNGGLESLKRLSAKIIGEDTVKMIQEFGIYRGQRPPSYAEIYRALRDTARIHADLTELYNVFSWFCLEYI
jgi:hypothetical protein